MGKNKPELHLDPVMVLVGERRHIGVNPMMVESWLLREALDRAAKVESAGKVPAQDDIFLYMQGLVNRFNNAWQQDQKNLLAIKKMQEVE